MTWKRDRWFIGIILLFVVFYFILRLPNLTLQPIFADEAIYIRWAQVMKSEPTLRFLPLSDGKTPLFMWLMMPVFKLVSDPLLAGRLLSIGAGLGTFFGVVILSAKFLNRRTAVWAGLLMVVTPWIVFFDRMALVDSMLAMWSIWSLFLVLWLSQKPRLDLAMILGFSLGGGILTKTPGMFQILLVPTSVISFWQFHRGKGLIKFLGLMMVSILIGFGIYNLLRLGPGFSSLSSRNGDYTHSPLILLQHPLDPFLPHLRDVLDWAPKLLSWPIFVIVLIGLVTPVMWRKQKTVWVIWLWSIVPLLIEMALLKTFTARYILSSVAPLLILGAFGLDQLIQRIRLSKRLAIGAVLVMVLAGSLDFNLRLLANPEGAPLPRAERRGYLEEWTAGNGLKEIAQYLTDQSKQGPIVVGTEGFFGTLPDGLFIYLDKTPNISIVGSSPLPSLDLRQSALDRPTFFVVNKSRAEKGIPAAELIKEYPKAVSPELPRDAMLLYKLLPVATSSAGTSQ